MFHWMKSGGAEFNKIKLRYYTEDYRGVHASADIKVDETILFVPNSQLITVELAKASPIGSLMTLKNLNTTLISPKHSYLATFLMEEVRKENSEFKNFLDVLPKGFSNFPIFFTQEECQLLQGSLFQKQISDKI